METSLPTHDVPVTAKDDSNNPLADVTVVLSNDSNNYETTTDSNGEANIPDVLFGTYDVILDGYDDYTPKTKTVNNASFRVDLIIMDA